MEGADYARVDWWGVELDGVTFARCRFDTRRHINHRRTCCGHGLADIIGGQAACQEPWRRAFKGVEHLPVKCFTIASGQTVIGGLGIKQKPVGNALIGLCGFEVLG